MLSSVPHGFCRNASGQQHVLHRLLFTVSNVGYKTAVCFSYFALLFRVQLFKASQLIEMFSVNSMKRWIYHAIETFSLV